MTGFALTLAGTACMVALDAAMSEPPILLQQLALLISSTGIQLVFPVLTLRMLDLFPHNRGSASSVQSFISLVLTSLVFGLLVPALDRSLLALASAAFVCALIAFSLWRIATYVSHARSQPAE